MQTHQEVIESSPTVATDRTPATTYDPYASRRSMSIKLMQAIYVAHEWAGDGRADYGLGCGWVVGVAD